jgi:hypothetical protein
MASTIAIIVVVAIGLAWTSSAAARAPREERSVLWAAFALHALCVAGLIAITSGFYGSGDIDMYGFFGRILAQLIWDDPTHYVPETLALLLQREVDLPIAVVGAGSSTGSMSAFAGLLMALLGGSFTAMNGFLGLIAFIAKVTLYRSVRESIPPLVRRQALAACTLIPSVAFWSAGIVKESIAMTALCFLISGVVTLSSRRLIVGALQLAPAITALSLIRPFALLALAIAGAAWFYARRSIRQRGELTIRPFYLLILGLATMFTVAMFGELFPQFALETMADQLASRQEIWELTVGGSGVRIVDAPERSLAGQLSYAPIALFSAVFRPVIFEVKNVMMLVNALETTALTWLFASSILQSGQGRWWKAVTTSPLAVFCVVFVCVFGIGVGLATANLGSLSRYRMPILPFFSLTTLIASSPATVANRLRSSAPIGVRRSR